MGQTKQEAYVDSLSKGNKLRRFLWNTLRILLYRPFGLPFFNGWRILILKLFGAKIGAGSIVYASSMIWAPWNLVLGERVCIGPNTNVYNPAPISIGDKVTISQGAQLCAASHDISYINKPLITEPIEICSYVWMCADAFVCLGVKVGDGAIVGARACVFKDVDSWTVVGGNPAKFIKKRELKDA